MKRWKIEWRIELIEKLNPEWKDFRAFAKFGIPAFCSIPPPIVIPAKAGIPKINGMHIIKRILLFYKSESFKALEKRMEDRTY
ncbi:hypothetical protein BH10BAC5_BH10BAC5_09530 [soil metagenome]